MDCVNLVFSFGAGHGLGMFGTHIDLVVMISVLYTAGLQFDPGLDHSFLFYNEHTPTPLGLLHRIGPSHSNTMAISFILTILTRETFKISQAPSTFTPATRPYSIHPLCTTCNPVSEYLQISQLAT